jgi:hypothetical protein
LKNEQIIAEFARYSEFGVFDLQCFAQWGFKQASRKLEELVRSGDFIRVPGKPWRFSPVQKITAREFFAANGISIVKK